MDLVTAADNESPLPSSIPSERIGGITVEDERRASLSSPGTTSTRESIPRRLSKSFQESEIPRGFLAATADMTSSVYAAARPRSSSGRTRSSTTSSADDRSRSLQQQQQQQQPQTRLFKSGDWSGSALATLDEQKGMSSAIYHEAEDEDNDDDDDDRKFKNGNGATVGQKEAKTASEPLPPSTLEADRPVSAARSRSDTAKSGNGGSADAVALPPAYGDGCGEQDTAYDNGYHFPPRYSKGESFRHGALAFWNYLRTPVGFLVVLYGLNVVAWGGMLFLLLCNAGPAMCYPTCNDINSPRRKWIEYDSQILNALFCVTGFGLAPWRFRDAYFYLQFWLGKDYKGLRRLAGVHRGWLRLPGSEHLSASIGPGHIPPDTPADAIPFPPSKIPDAPLTGQRAPPTRTWRIVFILGMNIGNTFLQVVLSGFMWGLNRYDRPSWSTGLFVALGCIAGALGGLGMFVEGKRVKSIEGVPLTDEDRQKLAADREHGIYHYNNIKGKKPKEKSALDVEAGQT